LKYFFIIIIAFLQVHSSVAQTADTNYLKALYDRTIGFAEEKLDSIAWNASYIEKQSIALKFDKGKILAQRLRGVHSDLSGNYEEAIRYFLFTLDAARAGSYVEYEISALSDLAIAYTEIKQPHKAKEVYLQCLNLTKERGEVSAIISGYSNIGAIYNILNMPDSALHYLMAALELCKSNGNYKTLPFIYNNTGNVYFKKKEFKKALEYFRMNKALHDSANKISDLWIDHLNMGDAFLELGEFDSATKYSNSALQMALLLESKSKEADSYSLISKLYERTGKYKKAWEYQQKWYHLDTALVNETSNRTIAEMQERFHASDREKQNRLLLAEIEKEKLQNKNLRSLTVAAVIIGILIGFVLLVYKRANRKLKEVNQVIVRQKEKMAALNQEKNSLISIVSHDLSSPFASISMWSQLIEKDQQLSDEQQVALLKIRDSASSGERLIRNILDVEKQGISPDKLELEEIDIGAFLSHIVSNHEAAATAKKILISIQELSHPVYLLTDQDLIRRIMDNLLSNAIKFSLPGKPVRVDIREQKEFIEISVTDEGVGIPENEKPLLFTKYAQLSVRPTGGETSTGLGLSIVKRMVSELNGTIQCDSEYGKGTRFTIRFPK
jgi:signal transduction histidine kinase